jgi:hypothetical protein
MTKSKRLEDKAPFLVVHDTKPRPKQFEDKAWIGYRFRDPKTMSSGPMAKLGAARCVTLTRAKGT